MAVKLFGTLKNIQVFGVYKKINSRKIREFSEKTVKLGAKPIEVGGFNVWNGSGFWRNICGVNFGFSKLITEFNQISATLQSGGPLFRNTFEPVLNTSQ